MNPESVFKRSVRRDVYCRNDVKELIGTGVAGMAGLGAIGVMGGIPGMPANNVGAVVGAGVSLANVGNLAKIGMNIIPRTRSKRKK